MPTVLLSAFCMTDLFLMMMLFFLKSLVSRRCVGFSIRVVPARKKDPSCAREQKEGAQASATANYPAFRRARRTSSSISAENDGIVLKNHHADSQMPALFASLGDYGGAGGHEEQHGEQHNTLAARRGPGSVRPLHDGPPANLGGSGLSQFMMHRVRCTACNEMRGDSVGLAAHHSDVECFLLRTTTALKGF
jgi:hypothetical protein